MLKERTRQLSSASITGEVVQVIIATLCHHIISFNLVITFVAVPHTSSASSMTNSALPLIVPHISRLGSRGRIVVNLHRFVNNGGALDGRLVHGSRRRRSRRRINFLFLSVRKILFFSRGRINIFLGWRRRSGGQIVQGSKKIIKINSISGHCLIYERKN